MSPNPCRLFRTPYSGEEQILLFHLLCSEERQEGFQQAWSRNRSCTLGCNGWAVTEIQSYQYTCQGKILAMNFLPGNKMEIKRLTKYPNASCK